MLKYYPLKVGPRFPSVAGVPIRSIAKRANATGWLRDFCRAINGVGAPALQFVVELVSQRTGTAAGEKLTIATLGTKPRYCLGRLLSRCLLVRCQQLLKFRKGFQRSKAYIIGNSQGQIFRFRIGLHPSCAECEGLPQ